MGGLLAPTLLLALLAMPAAAQPSPTTWYIAPSASGDASGSSPDDAQSLTRINRVIKAASPGDEIVILADRGPYLDQSSATIWRGGTPEAPITIRGGAADGSPATPLIQSTRSNPWTPDGKHGGEIFRLSSGADNLHVENLSFADVGTAFRIMGDVDNLHLRDMSATNIRRFLTTHLSGSEPSASLTNSSITEVRVAGFSKNVIRLAYNSHDVLVEDVVGDSQRQDGDNFAMGVHLIDSVHEVVLRRVGMHNSHDTQNEYWNGDGFATERGTYRITFEATSATGSTDGGYDLKSEETLLIAPYAADNKRNYRIWASATIVGCDSVDPVKRGGIGESVHLNAGADAVVDLYGCEFVGPADPDRIDPTATVTIDSHVPAAWQAELDRVLGFSDRSSGGESPDGPVPPALPEGDPVTDSTVPAPGGVDGTSGRQDELPQTGAVDIETPGEQTPPDSADDGGTRRHTHFVRN